MVAKTLRLRAWLPLGGMLSAMLVVIGCGKSPPVPEVQKQQHGDGDPQPQNPGPDGQGADTRPGVDTKSEADRYTKSFQDAALTEVIEGQQRPADVTITKKSTAKLRSSVEQLWSSIALTKEGKTIPYVVQIETADGPIEITLQPHLAPNHVRHFLALTKVGFYDGLYFERLIHQESETDGKKNKLDLVTAGCPLGTGEEGYGHIGYFVKAEIAKDVKHEEGTVGFWYDGEDPDAAGTRFYITLGPAPVLDGSFTVVGKVTKGLDLLTKISVQPVQGNEPPENTKPIRPTKMTKVTVSPEPVVTGNGITPMPPSGGR